MNEKGVLTANDIDGEISFSVTEQGWWDLSFDVVGDTDIDHADVVKVIEPGETTREYYNHRFIDFDGTNDYARSGKSITLTRRDIRVTGDCTLSSDWDGDYVTGFSSTGDGKYWDIGKLYNEIATDKAFAIKMTIRTPSTSSGLVLDLWPVRIQTVTWTLSVWFVWWTGRNFAVSTNTYYRIVASYNWAWTWTVWYNSTEATTAWWPTGTNENYCTLW
jgi:hypothetical protein